MRRQDAVKDPCRRGVLLEMSERAIAALQAQNRQDAAAVQELQAEPRRRAEAGIPLSPLTQKKTHLCWRPFERPSPQQCQPRHGQSDEASSTNEAWANRRRSAAKRWTSISGHESWRSASRVCTIACESLSTGWLTKIPREILQRSPRTTQISTNGKSARLTSSRTHKLVIAHGR